MSPSNTGEGGGGGGAPRTFTAFWQRFVIVENQMRPQRQNASTCTISTFKVKYQSFFECKLVLKHKIILSGRNKKPAKNFGHFFPEAAIFLCLSLPRIFTFLIKTLLKVKSNRKEFSKLF